MADKTNYEDERLDRVVEDANAAIAEHEKTYEGLIDTTDQFYKEQVEGWDQWQEKQTQVQNEQTDFAISQIEQQREQARKDYTKEQSGAYVDWQKQSDQYGVNAEKQASSGMTGTGFSESSQVAMYNQYQNRVTVARETMAKADMEFNNAIANARIQNSAALAQIALDVYTKKAETALQGFQHMNNLIQEQANKKVEMKNTAFQQYMQVLNQINTEKAFDESVRQFNQNYDLQMKQYNESIRQFNQEYSLKQAEYKEGIRQFNEEIARLKAKDAQEYQLEIKNLELKKKQMEQEQKQFEVEAKLKRDQLAEQKRQFDTQLKWQSAENAKNRAASGSGGGGGGGADYGAIIGGTIGVGSGAAVNTAYYQGEKNPDAKKYGTFANGYQPKGISGHGALTKSGQTIEVRTEVKYGVDKGKKQTLVQTIWKAADGTLWYWDGRDNEYKRVSVSGGGGRSID